MIGKLLKGEDGYYLFTKGSSVTPFACDLESWIEIHKGKRLSKENCDEIFGVVDVEKLADEYYTHEPKNVKELRDVNLIKLGFRNGFNKAMELNKDKLFGVKEVVELCKILLSNPIEKCGKTYEELTDNYIQSLQQPTEIEVEIVMGTLCRQIDCVDDARLVESKIVWGKEDPMLDKDGCLILKKK